MYKLNILATYNKNMNKHKINFTNLNNSKEILLTYSINSKPNDKKKNHLLIKELKYKEKGIAIRDLNHDENILLATIQKVDTRQK